MPPAVIELIRGGGAWLRFRLRGDEWQGISASCCRSSDANQARRLLALAAIRDSLNRQIAACIGGMDRQTLRDWVHAHRKYGLEGLINDTSPGASLQALKEARTALKALVEAGPDLARDGVVRWGCSDLVCVVERKFGVSVSEDTIAQTLRTGLFPHRHPAKASRTEEGCNGAL